jgi:hypothetical protein
MADYGHDLEFGSFLDPGARAGVNAGDRPASQCRPLCIILMGQLGSLCETITIGFLR